jgi:uncharacterized protein YjiS (DUF1127 family)
MSFDVHAGRSARVAGPAASARRALSARLRRITALWLQARRARSLSDSLQTLDDHLLFDIGLARSELQATAVPCSQADRRSA